MYDSIIRKSSILSLGLKQFSQHRKSICISTKYLSRLFRISEGDLFFMAFFREDLELDESSESMKYIVRYESGHECSSVITLQICYEPTQYWREGFLLTDSSQNLIEPPE